MNGIPVLFRVKGEASTSFWSSSLSPFLIMSEIVSYTFRISGPLLILHFHQWDNRRCSKDSLPVPAGLVLRSCLTYTRAVYRRVERCYTRGMKAYSQDLRQRVLRAVDAGQRQAEIAKTFTVSVATIKRYLKQRRETGHVQPKAIPGRPAKKGAVLQAHLRAQLEAHPDATREEHCRLFQAEQGIEVSTASISRARAALGWTRKKLGWQTYLDRRRILEGEKRRI